MGLFEKIFKPREYTQAIRDARGTFSMLTAYQPVFTSWNGAIYESELVRAAIDARARHISKLKVEYRGAAQPRLRTRLQHQPNDWQTYSQFLYRVSTILDCTNTCFIVPVLDDKLETVGFYPVLPQRATVLDFKGEPWLKYDFYNGQTGAIELSRCAVLTKYQYKSDFFGDDQRALADTMGVVHIQNEGIKEAVKNSATFRFMAQLSNFTNSKDGVSKERERFNKENLQKGGGGLLLFPNTYTNIQQIQNKPFTVDATQMNYIRQNVERYFGVNAEIMDNSASVDKMDAFFNGCVETFSIQFSEAMTKAIFTDVEQSYGSKVVASANRLQYMNTSAKVQLAKELGDRGAMTINEIRELFNYEPIPDGDVAFIRGEYYPVQEKVTMEEQQNENNEEL